MGRLVGRPANLQGAGAHAVDGVGIRAAGGGGCRSAALQQRQSFALGWVDDGFSPVLAMPHVGFAIALAALIAPSGWILRLLSPWFTGAIAPPP